MILNLMNLPLAMAAPAGEGAQPSPIGQFAPILIMVAIFYFLIIRPQMRREKERKNLINSLKQGDRVLFAGGMIGQVASIKDNTVMVQIADGVKVEVTRGSISTIFKKGEEVADLPA